MVKIWVFGNSNIENIIINVWIGNLNLTVGIDIVIKSEMADMCSWLMRISKLFELPLKCLPVYAGAIEVTTKKIQSKTCDSKGHTESGQK